MAHDPWPGRLPAPDVSCSAVPARGVRVLRRLWWVVRGVIWDVPSAIWHSRTVRGVRQSLAVRFLEYHFWSPFLITLLVLAILLVLGVKPCFLRPWTVYFWAILTLTYNTPWGWVVQDRIAEAVSDGWRLVPRQPGAWADRYDHRLVQDAGELGRTAALRGG